ncbi:unnamed protein product [Closterium sp. NIES-53]
MYSHSPPSTANPSLFLHTDTSLPPLYILVYVDVLVFATGPLALRLPVLLATAHSSAYRILARYVAPERHRPEHWEAAKRVLRYLCSTSGMELVLGGRGPVVLTGHADASWVDHLATQTSSSCEAEIYAGAMGAQELRWMTYLLTNLGERPRSSLSKE